MQIPIKRKFNFIFFLPIFVLAFEFFAWRAVAAPACGPLVVSDIDDTLKKSYIHHFWYRMTSSFETGTQKSFGGMSEVFNAVKESWVPEPSFHYVSNAPIFSHMPRNHFLFLKNNNFPQVLPEHLHLKQSLKPKEGDEVVTANVAFKIYKIRELIREHLERCQETVPDIILIGDNGEKDPLVYAQIQKDFAYLGDKHIHTYIHQIAQVNPLDSKTGTSLQQGQEGFVTSADLILQLFTKNLVSLVQVKSFISEIESKYDYEQFGLKWFNCARSTEFLSHLSDQIPHMFSEEQELQTHFSTILWQIRKKCFLDEDVVSDSILNTY